MVSLGRGGLGEEEGCCFVINFDEVFDQHAYAHHGAHSCL